MKLSLGTFLTREAEADFSVQITRKQFRHAWIPGKSGTGKSTLLRNIVANAINEGFGLLVIDPAGDLIDDCLDYVPQSRIRDLLYLGPDSDPVPGIGFFGDPNKELAIQTAMSIIEAHSGSGWGPQTAHILRNDLDAILEHIPRASILHATRFLSEPDYTKKLALTSENPLVRFFYDEFFKDLKPADRARAFSHPQNKLEEMIRPGLIEHLCQETPLDFLHILDDRKVMFCRLPKGKMGERPAQVLGSLILSALHLATMRRKKRSKPFLVVIDEIHNFIHGIDFETMLAESRKYGVHYIFATQTIKQMGDNADIAFGNVSHIFSFRVSASDSDKISDNMGIPLADESLVKLGNYEMAALTMIDNKPVTQKRVGVHQYPRLELKRGDFTVPARKAIRWAKNNTPGTPRHLIPDLVKQQLSA